MTAEPLSSLLQPIEQALQPLLEPLRAGRPLPPLGLRRSARLPVVAAWHGLWNGPLLLLTDRSDHALGLMEELALWLPQAKRLFFPEPAPLFYEDAAWGETTRRERLAVLTHLASYLIPTVPTPEPTVIVAPVRAVMTRTLPRREFVKASRMLHRGQTLSWDELTRALVALGYEAADLVIAPGQFARRGGLLDLWPPAEATPWRLELFGETLDTLRRFDPATQRTLRAPTAFPAERLLITPAREFLAPFEGAPPEEGEPYREFLIPLLHPTPASLLDYLPRQALVLLDDGQTLTETVSDIETQAVAMRQEAVREGTLPEDFPVPYLSLGEIQDALSLRTTLDLGWGFTEGENPPSTDLSLSLPSLGERFTPLERFGGQVKNFVTFLEERCRAGEAVWVVSRQMARLQALWREQRCAANETAPVFLEGSLAEGWRFHAPDGTTVSLFTDGEIFGWRRPEPRRRPQPQAEAPEASYSDLHPGDYVVHVDYGIGRYVGLVQRTLEGVAREYLCIEYAESAQLFVPIHQADRVSRYVGPDGRPPSLSRLGSSEWKTTKAYVKEAVQQVAEDLLELYARRSVARGFAFSPDNEWQRELEASFPYLETEDQKRVIAEVKQDMQAPRPMDRLICGDVGYGKTEVALRAAFKAVLDGKQVAMLVPTTVLAQQHYHTFCQRLAAYPVTIEMLSRFRTPQQQRQIVEGLRSGRVDIVIGTHRLLSPDVAFKDLGLLIIDEEQRFGVTHKEALKKLRTEVDVLTLTATPIPRTLYMALSGVRDISTINTPPEERLPVITHVGPYSPRLVRQAILRELERGGQVFFVHNRVQTIGAMYAHLRQLVPQARIVIAHGQMPEQELAQRMQAFAAGEVDVLLCTSIIESGLDIPNANTLIVDRADTFGLAQLYQLRGRVGRGAQRAYAYFFRHSRKLPTLEARQRLQTIAENTQLGAGFSIAMRDLEIRGAGEILGLRQHGHIAAVGFHLYTALLAEAVRRLRQKEGLPLIPLPPTYNLQLLPVNVELPLPTAIPPHYVPDLNVRLGLYRRMADLRHLDELDALAEEFHDRFGPPPEAVHHLFLQLKIKLLAEKAAVTYVGVENGQLTLRFAQEQVPDDLPPLDPKVRVGKTALWLPYSRDESWADILLRTLEALAAYRASSPYQAPAYKVRDERQAYPAF